MLRLAALVLALLAVAGGTASALYQPARANGDLDGDGDKEIARAIDANGDGQRTAVHIRDDCPDGSEIDRLVSGVEDDLAFLKLYRADTRRGAEVFIDLRSGATGRVGQARLVAWRASPDGQCPRPRYLFRYFSSRASRPPRGASENSSFAMQVRNVTDRYRGREIVLDEFYVTREIPAGCCPSFQKRRLFRYSRALDRYVHYKTRVYRLMR